MTQTWPIKDPREKLVATFQFLDEIDEGETISSAIVDCVSIDGADTSPGNVLNGAPLIDGTTVLQVFHGGVSGGYYSLSCAATLSPSGRVLVLSAILPVLRAGR